MSDDLVDFLAHYDAKGTVKVKDISPLTAEQINKAQIEVFGPKPIEDTG